MKNRRKTGRGFFELPLLRRELTEMAQRKRTYAVRSVGAVLLLTGTWYGLSQLSFALSTVPSAGGFSPLTVLGTGGALFRMLVPFLFLAVPLLAPALFAPAITSEKEQNTLGMLLITRLSPWTIVLEKFLSRLVPLVSVLMLISPVLAWLYSLGGMESGELFGVLLLLSAECLLFGSLSLFLSAWFPTSVSAFTASYLLAVFLVLFGLMAVPVTGFSIWILSMWPSTVVPGRGVSTQPLWWFAVQSLVPFLLSCGFLVAARVVVVRRAFASPSSLVMRLFRRVDEFYRRLNERTTGGIEVIRESDRLPGDDPIAWRERTRRALGQVRWLVRVLLVLETPTLFLCVLLIDPTISNRVMDILEVMLRLLVVALASVKGTSLFSQERARQTLEPLLSTKLTTREIALQKVSGTSRLLLVLTIPLTTVILTKAYMAWRGDLVRSAVYVVLSTLLIVLFLRIAVWLSMMVGMVVRSPTRAIMVSLAVVFGSAAVAGAPVFLAGAIGAKGLVSEPEAVWLQTILPIFSPLHSAGIMDGLIAAGRTTVYEFMRSRETFVTDVAVLATAVAAVGVHAVYLVGIRSFVLNRMPRLLQRHDSPVKPPDRVFRSPLWERLFSGVPFVLNRRRRP